MITWEFLLIRIVSRTYKWWALGKSPFRWMGHWGGRSIFRILFPCLISVEFGRGSRLFIRAAEASWASTASRRCFGRCRATPRRRLRLGRRRRRSSHRELERRWPEQWRRQPGGPAESEKRITRWALMSLPKLTRRADRRLRNQRSHSLHILRWLMWLFGRAKCAKSHINTFPLLHVDVESKQAIDSGQALASRASLFCRVTQLDIQMCQNAIFFLICRTRA